MTWVVKKRFSFSSTCAYRRARFTKVDGFSLHMHTQGRRIQTVFPSLGNSLFMRNTRFRLKKCAPSFRSAADCLFVWNYTWSYESILLSNVARKNTSIPTDKINYALHAPRTSDCNANVVHFSRAQFMITRGPTSIVYFIIYREFVVESSQIILNKKTTSNFM